MQVQVFPLRILFFLLLSGNLYSSQERALDLALAISEGDLQAVRNNFECLDESERESALQLFRKKLDDHQNQIKFFENNCALKKRFYQQDVAYNLVLTLLSGGDLFLRHVDLFGSSFHDSGRKEDTIADAACSFIFVGSLSNIWDGLGVLAKADERAEENLRRARKWQSEGETVYKQQLNDH